jgi:hypothetical protein
VRRFSMITNENNEMAKRHIRVSITNLSAIKRGENPEDGFYGNRNDGYATTADWGYEDLDLREDAEKIQLYMTSNVLTFNNNKYYRVVRRIFQPNRPVTLYIDVEETSKSEI